LASQREAIERTVFDVRDPALQRYILGLFQGAATERTHVVFLDTQWRFIADEAFGEGDGAQVLVNPRALVVRANDLGAAGLVLAHNHPSGAARPSNEDVQTTRRLGALLHNLGLVLADHLIVAGAAVVSMRAGGWL
jgi:DNA repair protein RadC